MKRILIVDDQQDIRELIRMTLEMEDFEIFEAVNGDEGLKSALQIQPDLILLDVMMPGSIDGVEVCRRIRADARTKRAKVLMLSAKAQPADKAAGLQAGANDYLLKPFSPRQLLDQVMRMA
jgi:DNA-binding response OmpR family regulator